MSGFVSIGLDFSSVLACLVVVWMLQLLLTYISKLQSYYQAYI